MGKVKKISFWKRLISAIKDFDYYQVIVTETLGTSIKYFLKLMLVFSFIISIGFSVKINEMVHQAKDYIAYNLPEFTFENNILTFETGESIKIINENSPITFVMIDTIEEDENKKDEIITQLKTYNTGIAFFKDKVVMKAFVPGGGTLINEYEELNKKFEIGDFNKAQLLEKLSTSNIIYFTIAYYIAIVLSMFVIYTVFVLIDVILLSVLGYLFSRVFAMKLKYIPVLNIAMYALTLSILLNSIYILIYMLTGFEINGFSLMYNIISYIYMITAIILIKSDLIKKQAELMKIVEEQEKIRLELERKKEEEELERQKEEVKKKDREKQNKEKKPKVKNESPEPKGSEA